MLSELGFAVRREGDELHGHARVVPAMHVPGTSIIRVSILAGWADTLCGLLTVGRVQPRVPVTLQLEVDLYEPPVGASEINARARILKAGESVVMSEVDLADGSGRPIGKAMASFMVARDPALKMHAELDDLLSAMGDPRGPLTVPFADRAGCVPVEPGVVKIDFAPERSNASGTLNGGLLALAAEEAALSTRPGETLSMMALRFLRAVRVGPALAISTWTNEVNETLVTDHGRGDIVAMSASLRTFTAAQSAGHA